MLRAVYRLLLAAVLSAVLLAATEAAVPLSFLPLRTAAAAPFCNVTTWPRESGIRTPGRGAVRIDISGATLAASVPPNSTGRLGLTSTTGLVKPQMIVFVTDELPHYIQINLATVSQYEIFEDDHVGFSIPSDFFVGEAVGCPNLDFTIRPSAGVIGLDTLPFLVTEVDITQGDVTFPLIVTFDQFMSDNVTWNLTRFDAGLTIGFALRSPPPSSILDVTIYKNASFNIPRFETIELDIVFPPSMMRSGEAPIIGIEIYRLTSVVVPIEGSKPEVRTEYRGGAVGLAAEAMWDGTANVTLRLLGDTWANTALLHWNNRTHGPSFDVSAPVQPNGFTLFLSSGAWPVAVIDARTIVLTFPSTVGFALTTEPIEEVSISNLEPMMSEYNEAISSGHGCGGGCGSEGCFCASVRILRANTSNIRVLFISPAFDNLMTESDVRRYGLNITITLAYDIFSTTAVGNMNIIRSIFVTNAFLSLDSIEVRTFARGTALSLLIPPQIGYDIAEGTTDMIEVKLPQSLSGTLAALTPAQSTRRFFIQSVRTPICRMPVFEITEADIRSKDVAVNISVYGDAFCFDPTPTGAPLSSPAVARFLSGIKTKHITFVLRSYTAQSLIVVFSRNYSYDISRTEIVAIPLPSELLCSLETCRADPEPLPPETANTLTIPIRHVAGTVVGTFPTLDERFFRVSDLSVEVAMIGETFAQGVFSVGWTVATRDPERGFLGTIASSCDGVRTPTNFSRATISCRQSSRYDISANETVRVVIPATTVAGLLAPSAASVVPLVVTPVVGTVHADNASRFVELTEAEVVRGGAQFSISLEYERFNVTHLTEAFVQSVVVHNNNNGSSASSSSAADPLGILGSAADVFAPAGFSFSLNEDQLVLTMQPAPNYDITENETFTFSVSADAVASKMAPFLNNFTVRVVPSPGAFALSGSAVFASARQVLEEELVLNIRLVNDVWADNADFVVRDLCPLEKISATEVPTCVVYVDESRRVLTILFPPSERFSLYTNTTYTIPIKPDYIRSGLLPPEAVSMFIYVSAGRISWSGPSVVTEEAVHGGAVPIITVRVGGDALADARAVRASLVASATCVGSNDRYGFCGRAEYLFGDGFTLVGDARRQMQIRLQPNEDFDVYEAQSVTLRLSGDALVSRFNPNFNESFTFTIVPTVGQFFISGLTDTITERDISGVTRKSLQMVLTLYGERWLSNKSRVVPLLVAGIGAGDAGSHEANGFTRYKSEIITPDGSTVSDSGRVMTVQLAAAPDYDIYYNERVTISIVGACVLSGMAPALRSTTNSFLVLATGGLIEMKPTAITADVLRAEGVLLTLAVEGDQWKTEVVQDPVAILEAIRVGSSPQQEPNGFAVNLDTALADIRSRGSSINGTSLIITLMPMPTYSLVKPETITLFLRQGWTTSGLPLVPNEFTLTVAPVYEQVEALLDLEPFRVRNATSGALTNETTFDLTAWVAKVAAALSVAPGAIVVEYFGPEPLLPEGADVSRYRRVTFRVRNLDSSDGSGSSDGAPYDNRAASNFVSYAPSFLDSRFSVQVAFFNNTPPDASYWLRFRPAVETKEAFFIPINKNIIWILAAVIAAVLVGVGVYLYCRTRSMLGGVSRAKVVDKAGTRKAALAEEAAERAKRFDRSVYSGQAGDGRGGGGVGDDDEGGGGGTALGALSASLLSGARGASPGAGVQREGASPMSPSSPSGRGGGGGGGIQFEYELPLDLYAGQSPMGFGGGADKGGQGPALVVPERPPLPFEEVEAMEVELTAVYPPHTRPAEMFLAKKRRSRRGYDFL